MKPRTSTYKRISGLVNWTIISLAALALFEIAGFTAIFVYISVPDGLFTIFCAVAIGIISYLVSQSETKKIVRDDGISISNHSKKAGYILIFGSCMVPFFIFPKGGIISGLAITLLVLIPALATYMVLLAKLSKTTHYLRK